MTVPKGRYVIDTDDTVFFRLKGLDGVTVDFGGSELVCKKRTRYIGLEHCTNTVVRNVTLDMDPLPFSQGVIEKVGPDGSWEVRVLDDYALFGQAACSKDVAAPRAGYLCHMDTEGIGMASVALGAGRAKKEDAIDMLAGIRLAAKTGDRVEQGAVLATLYAATPELLEEGERRLLASLEFADEPVAERPHFFARVSCAGVEAYD